MGDKLMRRVVLHVWPSAHYAALSHAARVVLLRMAQQAMDSDDQPTYFGGWEPLSWCLGYPTQPALDPADPDPTVARDRATAERAVGRAMRELRRAGLVIQDGDHPRHHKRRWHLTVPTFPGTLTGAVDPLVSNGARSPPIHPRGGPATAQPA